MPRNGLGLDVRTGPDEVTVAIRDKEFRRRRRQARWRRARPWIIGVLVAGLLAGGAWLIWFSQYMLVTGAQVSGTRELSERRVVEAAAVPTGVQLARVDLGAVEARVESIPAVKDADVSRSWPDTVGIEVVERTPIAAVERPGSEGLQAVDADGVLFLSYDERPEGLPLVRTAPDVRTEALAEAASVIAALRSDVAAKVRSLDVESVDRIVLRLDDDLRVLWGSAEQSADKADVLAALLDRKVGYIDVSVPGRPVTR